VNGKIGTLSMNGIFFDPINVEFFLEYFIENLIKYFKSFYCIINI